MPRSLLIAVLAALLGGPLPAGAQADTTATAIDSNLTTAADPSTVTVDPLLAWTAWPDLSRAIALEILDGPQDILEKEEIIADRIDALAAEGARLDTLAEAWGARHLAMSTQLEVLDDLAEVQLGGDLELQQRLESVRQDVEQASSRLQHIGDARLRLTGAHAQLDSLARDYRERAARLRAQEEGDR